MNEYISHACSQFVYMMWILLIFSFSSRNQQSKYYLQDLEQKLVKTQSEK